MSLRFPLVEQVWYHCYNRGAHKRKTFLIGADYARFQTLLWACNGTQKIQLSDWKQPSIRALLNDNVQRGNPLVDIAAYCLMPNHVHVVLRPLVEKGASVFMQRLFTAYLMYFNKRHHRTGVLFAGPFKSKHVDDDRYFKRVVPYVLLNVAPIIDSDWAYTKKPSQSLKEKLLTYRYSSLPDFLGEERVEGLIVGDGIRALYETRPGLDEMLTEARAFYHEEIPEY